jgi:hypothetical protein
MKKLVFSSIVIIFAVTTAQAQIKTKTEKIRPQIPSKIITPVAEEPKTPAPPPPTNKTAGAETAQTALVYRLTAVKANIRTGNDNKEYPSVVRTSLGVRGSQMEYAYFVQANLKNEMRSNTNTEFGLEKGGLNLKEITLDALQSAGLHFRISYVANFQLDAWKIEGVTLTLEFRDQNGNLHPSLAQKTITFSNANGFLNGYNGTTDMICNTDGYFNPLSAFIQ